MDAPDLREMVARAINSADNEWADAPRTMPHEAWPHHVAAAVLAVPAIADALAAHAAVKEFAAQWATDDDGLMDVLEGLLSAHGDRDDSKEQR